MTWKQTLLPRFISFNVTSTDCSETLFVKFSSLRCSSPWADTVLLTPPHLLCLCWSRLYRSTRTAEQQRESVWRLQTGYWITFTPDTQNIVLYLVSSSARYSSWLFSPRHSAPFFPLIKHKSSQRIKLLRATLQITSHKQKHSIWDKKASISHLPTSSPLTEQCLLVCCSRLSAGWRDESVWQNMHKKKYFMYTNTLQSSSLGREYRSAKLD